MATDGEIELPPLRAREEFGNGTRADTSTPTRVSGNHLFTVIDGGGELGDGTFADRTAPVPVSGNKVFKSLAAGDSLSCGITTAGETFCWGFLLGSNGGGITRNVPERLSPDPDFEQISAGQGFACGLTAEGVAWCWGSNNYGQLGNRSTGSGERPVRIVAP